MVTVAVQPAAVRRGGAIRCTLSEPIGIFYPVIPDGRILAPHDVADNGAPRTALQWQWDIAYDAPLGDSVVQIIDSNGTIVASTPFTVAERLDWWQDPFVLGAGAILVVAVGFLIFNGRRLPT